MHDNATPLLLETARIGRSHVALASFSSSAARTTSGRAYDRESAIAEALHLGNVFYADHSVELEVLLAEARRVKVKLLLAGNTLHLDDHIERRGARRRTQ